MLRPIKMFRVVLNDGDSFTVEATDFEPSGLSVSFYREYPSVEPFGNPHCSYIAYYSDVKSVKEVA